MEKKKRKTLDTFFKQASKTDISTIISKTSLNENKENMDIITAYDCIESEVPVHMEIEKEKEEVQKLKEMEKEELRKQKEQEKLKALGKQRSILGFVNFQKKEKKEMENEVEDEDQEKEPKEKEAMEIEEEKEEQQEEQPIEKEEQYEKEKIDEQKVIKEQEPKEIKEPEEEMKEEEKEQDKEQQEQQEEPEFQTRRSLRTMKRKSYSIVSYFSSLTDFDQSDFDYEEGPEQKEKSKSQESKKGTKKQKKNISHQIKKETFFMNQVQKKEAVLEMSQLESIKQQKESNDFLSKLNTKMKEYKKEEEFESDIEGSSNDPFGKIRKRRQLKNLKREVEIVVEEKKKISVMLEPEWPSYENIYCPMPAASDTKLIKKYLKQEIKEKKNIIYQSCSLNQFYLKEIPKEISLISQLRAIQLNESISQPEIQNWEMKYQPKSLKEIIVSEIDQSKLKLIQERLQNWQSNSVSDSESEYDSFWDHNYIPQKNTVPSNVIYHSNGNLKSNHLLNQYIPDLKNKRSLLLYSPNATFKTSLLQVLSKELNWQVLEMNALQKRSSSDLQKIISEFSNTKSFANANIMNTSTMKSFFGKKKNGMIIKDDEEEKKGKMIILENVDLVDEKVDSGFWKAVLSMIEETKFPIIMTANDLNQIPDFVLNDLSDPESKIDFCSFSYSVTDSKLTDQLLDRLLFIINNENLFIERKDLEQLLKEYVSNGEYLFNKILNDLEFYSRSCGANGNVTLETHETSNEKEEQADPEYQSLCDICPLLSNSTTTADYMTDLKYKEKLLPLVDKYFPLPYATELYTHLIPYLKNILNAHYTSGAAEGLKRGRRKGKLISYFPYESVDAEKEILNVLNQRTLFCE